jgi:AraC family transcriptional regulator, regulatory protein of adaptative response / methylated-DNA-[protein]-cysteine methyltransferase
MTQEKIDYYRIAEAIEYILHHFKEQPALEKIASEINLSPFHFQRLFTEWAGVSPKKFIQYISIEHAKKILKECKNSIFDTALETGLSGTSRLHDLFINIEGMTPGEYKNGGRDLTIKYSFYKCHFGKVIIASTSKGICHLAFADSEKEASGDLFNSLPNANFEKVPDPIQYNALQLIANTVNPTEPIKLHLKGTEFQLKVWSALLKIPAGKLTTYGDIARTIGNPKASRAVGTAVGDNPVAYLIPCHRIIRSSGIIGEYHWASIRKTAILGWEASQINTID